MTDNLDGLTRTQRKTRQRRQRRRFSRIQRAMDKYYNAQFNGFKGGQPYEPFKVIRIRILENSVVSFGIGKKFDAKILDMEKQKILKDNYAYIYGEIDKLIMTKEKFVRIEPQLVIKLFRWSEDVEEWSRCPLFDRRSLLANIFKIVHDCQFKFIDMGYIQFT